MAKIMIYFSENVKNGRGEHLSISVHFLTLFERRDVGAEIDVAEGAGADLAAQPVLVSHSQLHP